MLRPKAQHSNPVPQVQWDRENDRIYSRAREYLQRTGRIPQVRIRPRGIKPHLLCRKTVVVVINYKTHLWVSTLVAKPVPFLGTDRTGPRSNTQGSARRAALAFDTQRAVRAPTRAASRVLVHAQGHWRHALSFLSRPGAHCTLTPAPLSLFCTPSPPRSLGHPRIRATLPIKKGGGST